MITPEQEAEWDAEIRMGLQTAKAMGFDNIKDCFEYMMNKKDQEI